MTTNGWPGIADDFPYRWNQLWLIAFFFLAVSHAQAQSWDLPAQLHDYVQRESDGKLQFSFEQRERYENHDGQNFGKSPDLAVGLSRTRLGMSYLPAPWIKLSGMAQDSRAPWFGPGAPNTLRDEVDLQEGYFEILPDRKKGFGMTVGRKMLNYGDSRLIGSPQWSNLSRTFDHTRLYYKLPKAQIEVLMVSSVKIRQGEFNRPNLGDRVWGTYDVFSGLIPKATTEFYILRHDQNHPGGFTGGKQANGTDRLGTTTFGSRVSGSLPVGLKYTLEGALQNGNVGAASQRAGAWVSNIGRRWTIKSHPLDILGEYKYASGTSNPADPTRAGTFDQLYPANHDKFGHEDLFGWRNMHNLRSLNTFGVTSSLAINFLYDDIWLASARDSLYNSQGNAIATVASGSAGTHVGRETDLFFTWKYHHFTVGGGYGYLFAGEFIRKATPGVNPSYAYLFHTYSF